MMQGNVVIHILMLIAFGKMGKYFYLSPCLLAHLMAHLMAHFSTITLSPSFFVPIRSITPSFVS